MNDIPWELTNIIRESFLENARGCGDLAPGRECEGVEVKRGRRVVNSFLIRICETSQGTKLVCPPNVKLIDVVALRLDDRLTYNIPLVLLRPGLEGSCLVGQALGDLVRGRVWWPSIFPHGKHSYFKGGGILHPD